MLQPKMPEAAKMTSMNKGAVSMPTLPSITVNKMTQAQLRKFIPHLLRNVASDGKPGFGSIAKPMWWPNDIPWHLLKLDQKTNSLKEMANLDSLKRIVGNCYRYYGQERLLNGSPSSPESATSSLTIIDNYYMEVVNDVNKQNAGYTRVERWGELPYCNLRSSPRTRRVNHSLLPDLVPNKPLQDKGFPPQEAKPFVEIYICFFCEKEFKNKAEMSRHQAQCKEQPPELQVVLSLPRQPIRIQPPQISPIPAPCNPPVRPPKRTFMDKLNLLACHKAKEIKAKVRESTDVDCEIIDVIEPPKTPVALTPPRTPKLLISQLSRDESWTRRKSASFSWAPVDVSDDESVNSILSENEFDRISTCQRNASLLSIPFTSLLGQRIRKHVKSEGQSVVTNVESFCKTPVKNNALQRLRERQSNYPVTFKKTKRFSTKHSHEYKFNRKQKEEFVECLKVGLSKRSLRLLKNTRKCSVKLKRLTKLQLSFWLKRGQKGNKPATVAKPGCVQNKTRIVVMDQMRRPLCVIGPTVFPKQPALLSADMDRILGLKKKIPQENHQQSTLPLGSMVSEQLNAEASQQKLTVYRSLLSEYSTSHSMHTTESSKLPCLTNLLLAPNGRFALPKKPTQLAQMLNTPLSQLPVQPPSITANHVENWLTNNNFHPKDGDHHISVKKIASQNYSAPSSVNRVDNPVLQRGAKRKLDRQFSRSNKSRKVKEKEDDRMSLDTSDSISIHTLSSSEDEADDQVDKSGSTSDGLPVIKNTFSLAPGYFQPAMSDRGLRLIIPPLPNFRLPPTVRSRVQLPSAQTNARLTPTNLSTAPFLQKSQTKSSGSLLSSLTSSDQSSAKSSPVKSDSSLNSSTGSGGPVRRSKRLQVLHPGKDELVMHSTLSVKPVPVDKVKPAVEIICID